MEEMLKNGEVDAAVTMHFPFPIGVSTVGRVVTPAKGREMFVANTTGTSSADRIEGMIKNTIYGIIAAKTCGIANPTVGILNVDGARQTEKALKELQEKFSSEIKVVTSGNIWIDFIVPGCNKGSALRNLMDLFGITPEECVAFGDQYNDVEMLETVGMGYAMSNAAPGIAGHAKYITDSVEEVLEDILAGLDL